MNSYKNSKVFIKACAAFLFSLFLCANAGAATNLHMEVGAPGSSSYVFAVALQSILQNNLPVKINLTANIAATRGTLDGARGDADLFMDTPSINYHMQNKSEMFSRIDRSVALNKNVRGIINFPLGPYQIMVHADSGITSLKQIKGKRVFIGPPGGAATVVGEHIIEGVTGYKAGVDYDEAKLDWSSGAQAFQDDQVDLYIVPNQVPSGLVQQIVLLEKVRFLGIPDAAFSRLLKNPLRALRGLKGAAVVLCRNGQGGALS